MLTCWCTVEVQTAAGKAQKDLNRKRQNGLDDREFFRRFLQGTAVTSNYSALILSLSNTEAVRGLEQLKFVGLATAVNTVGARVDSSQ